MSVDPASGPSHADVNAGQSNDGVGKTPSPADLLAQDNDDGSPEESLEETMTERLKKEAEERTTRKEAEQRTLVGIEIKPYSVEQDLMDLWKKITQQVKQDGLVWGEACTLQPVAFGIKKIVTTFTMGVNNSSEDVQEQIETIFEDEVQSVDITDMNVL